ncbi:MAG TPA: hypothetical protein VHW01_25945 [Polyangiaceae bacterium]|jgi:hypothetical protein|nr:hypothetical protein [Polyangiaceae bacterium]
MLKQLLGVALALLATCACSSTPSDSNTGDENTGTVSLPLTSVVGAVNYRLTSAKFTISGAPLSTPRVITPAADLAIDTETLTVGHYSVLLANGWVLERKGAEAGAVFKAVPATLVTPNPTAFDIKLGQTVNAWFIFETGDGDVGLGQGNVNVRIGVQDCTSFNAYESALATDTVDCLGTITPDSFTVNADGILERNFKTCPLDPTRLRPIDSLLSLQFRTARLPFAKECMADRYSKFQASFAQSGVTQCPIWKKSSIVNPITAAVIDRVIPLLPKLPAEDNGAVDPTTGGPLPFLAPLKQNALYTVAFPNPAPGQKCDTPAACAAVCAGGFPGFVLATDGATVLTDPPAWLLDTSFSATTTDPFLRPGYYHPMSYYGGAPGTVFADATRACPVQGSAIGGVATQGAPCTPETCSYFSGIHVKYPLQLDCLDPTDFSTCVGYCAPPPTSP